MNPQMEAILRIACDRIEGWPVSIERDTDEAIHRAYRSDPNLEEVLIDTIDQALYDYQVRITHMLFSMPGFVEYINAISPDDYEIDPNYIDCLHDMIQVNTTAGELRGLVAESFLWTAMQKEMDDEKEARTRTALVLHRDRLFGAPIFKKYTHEQIEDYINECEHQDGLEYWEQFKSVSELYRDVELYYMYPDPEDDNEPEI